MSKRAAGIWETKLIHLGFHAYRCDQGEGQWTIWCSDTAEGGAHFWEKADVQAFLHWAERQGIV